MVGVIEEIDGGGQGDDDDDDVEHDDDGSCVWVTWRPLI